MKARRGEGEGSVDLARAEFPDSLKGGGRAHRDLPD